MRAAEQTPTIASGNYARHLSGLWQSRRARIAAGVLALGITVTGCGGVAEGGDPLDLGPTGLGSVTTAPTTVPNQELTTPPTTAPPSTEGAGGAGTEAVKADQTLLVGAGCDIGKNLDGGDDIDGDWGDISKKAKNTFDINYFDTTGVDLPDPEGVMGDPTRTALREAAAKPEQLGNCGLPQKKQFTIGVTAGPSSEPGKPHETIHPPDTIMTEAPDR